MSSSSPVPALIPELITSPSHPKPASMSSSSLVPTLTPELLGELKDRSERVLLYLINTNSTSRYVRESPSLQPFHDALSQLSDPDPSSLLHAFRSTVPLTSYDSYQPFISRFLEKPCKESELKDLFSPGLPYFIAISSATSGGAPKHFAKYRHPPGIAYESVDKSANPVSSTGGTNCIVYSLGCSNVLQIEGSEAQIVKQIPITLMSSGSIRMQNGIDIDKDPWMITLTAPRATSPVAVSFISKYRSFLLMHALFALHDRNLETMNTLFGTVFLDMIRYIEEEWDTLIDCIEHGKLPDLEGIDHVRQYLEPKFIANPTRATELRTIGVVSDRPGWLREIWPGFKCVIGIASGIFAAVIPKMRYYLGPHVHMRSLGFTASETYVGTVHGDGDLNQFKVVSDDLIEYLELAQEETTENVLPAWEVGTGKQYELILTTRDGMWRYRLGDIVEIAGFDPEDGSPIIKYVERRNVAMRLSHAQTSERQLVDAIFTTTADTIGPVTEFTVVRDERQIPATFGYIVETSGPLGPNAHLARQQVLDSLIASNENIQRSLSTGSLRPPTIRIVKPGSFRDFRRWRIEELNVGAGQMKIPVVLREKRSEDWLVEKVIHEV